MHGGCHCGNVTVDVELTAAPETYHPRACDCDFCRKHGAAWLSDAKGSLRIQINDSRESSVYRQGSEQAQLLVCRTCGVLVAVSHRAGNALYAAVNVKVFDAPAQFGVEQVVSPKKLAPDEKCTRWHNLWFPNVEIRELPRATPPSPV